MHEIVPSIMTAVGSPASSSDELGRLLEQELGDDFEASLAEGAGAQPGTPEFVVSEVEPIPPAKIDATLTSHEPEISSSDPEPRSRKKQKTAAAPGHTQFLPFIAAQG